MSESHGGIQSGTKAKGCEHCRQDGCSGHSCRPGATPNQTLCGLLFQVWEMMGPRLVLLLSAALMEYQCFSGGAALSGQQELPSPILCLLVILCLGCAQVVQSH